MSERKKVAQSKASSQALCVHTMEEWSGPLPPPAVLQGYKSISNDVLETVLYIVKEHTAVNVELQRKAMEEQCRVDRADERLAFISRILATIVVLSGFCLCGFLAKIGHPKIAAILCGGELTALVIAFIYTNRRHV